MFLREKTISYPKSIPTTNLRRELGAMLFAVVVVAGVSENSNSSGASKRSSSSGRCRGINCLEGNAGVDSSKEHQSTQHPRSSPEQASAAVAVEVALDRCVTKLAVGWLIPDGSPQKQVAAAAAAPECSELRVTRMRSCSQPRPSSAQIDPPHRTCYTAAGRKLRPRCVHPAFLDACSSSRRYECTARLRLRCSAPLL